MPRDLTTAEELRENVGIVQSLLNAEKYWANPDRVAAYCSKRQDEINRLQAEIDQAHKRHAEAPDRMKSLRDSLTRAQKKVAEWEARHEIAKLQKLAKLAAELEKQVDAD